MANPVLLITGASSGIGAETARQAVNSGYDVVLAARSVNKLEALAAEVGTDRAHAVQCDVTDWDSQQQLTQQAIDRFGKIDAVFANAGFGAKRGFLNESPELWKDMVLTNVYGAALTVRANLEAIKETAGHFLLTGSVAGRRALPGSLYSCTKWSVTAMGEALRLELNESGCRVTLIEPGLVATPFFDNQPENALQADDVARAVIYALSQPKHVDVNEVLLRPTAQSV